MCRIPGFLLVLFVLVLAAPGAVGQESGDVDRARVVVVPVQGNVGAATTRLVMRALSVARSAGIARLVLEIDTPDEPVDDLTEVATLLSGLRDAQQGRGLRVSAYIARQAPGYGGYLALAADEMFLASGATIGPVSPLEPGLVGIEQAEFDAQARQRLDDFRSRLRALVEARDGAGSDAKLIAEALADPRLELYEVTWIDPNDFEKTSLLTVEQLSAIGNSGGEVLRREALGNAPLSLGASAAMRYGLARGVHDTLDDVVREEFALGPDEVYRLDSNWSESAVAWLESVKPVLFLLGFLLLLVEAKAPGTFLPATLGVLLIGLGLFSSYLVGLADWTEILLFVVGLGLIGVELFVMPGTLLFGMAGFVIVLSALVLSQQTFFLPSSDVEFAILTANLLDLLFLLLLTMAGGLVLQRVLPRVPLFRKVLLEPPPDQSLSGDATRFHSVTEVSGGSDLSGGSALLGVVARAATDLRPSGIIELADGNRQDVVADGTFIARGSAVRIVDVEGNRIVVELADDPAAARPAGDPEAGVVSFGVLVMLVLVGLALVVAEVFFVSAGVLSIAAAVSLVSAVFLAFTHHGQAVGMGFLSAAAVGVPVALTFALKLLPRTALGRKIILSGPKAEDVHAAAQEPGLDDLVGRRGVATSRLRPSGYARIDGRRIDVVTRGEMIERDRPVRVLMVDSNRVVVAEVREAEPPVVDRSVADGPAADGPANEN